MRKMEIATDTYGNAKLIAIAFLLGDNGQLVIYN
jgi:hypothetical protein